MPDSLFAVSIFVKTIARPCESAPNLSQTGGSIYCKNKIKVYLFFFCAVPLWNKIICRFEMSKMSWHAPIKVWYRCDSQWCAHILAVKKTIFDCFKFYWKWLYCISVFSCGHHIVWLRRLFWELCNYIPIIDGPAIPSSIINTYSTAAMSFTIKPSVSVRNGHIDLKFHYIRQLVHTTVIRFKHVQTIN